MILDAGTGFIPAAWNFIEEMNRGVRYNILFTHWHYDHIVGLTLAPPTFIDQMSMTLYGPVDAGTGPREMIGHLFERPFFPVDAKQISHKMEFIPLSNFDVMVIVCHAKGGFVTLSLDTYKILLKNQT